MRHHVLIYHYCMVTEPCERFNRFVNSTDYKFATVDTTNDVKALSVTGLAYKNLVEIGDHYRVWGDNPQVHGIIVAISKGGSDKYGVSNPQGAKGKINILSSPICH